MGDVGKDIGIAGDKEDDGFVEQEEVITKITLLYSTITLIQSLSSRVEIAFWFSWNTMLILDTLLLDPINSLYCKTSKRPNDTGWHHRFTEKHNISCDNGFKMFKGPLYAKIEVTSLAISL